MRQHKSILVWTAAALLIVAGGCRGGDDYEADTATTEATDYAEPAAPAGASVQVTLQAANDPDFTGTVTFTQDGDSVAVVADFAGVDTPGKHGFHIHEHGTCDAHDAFASAGGHWNPDGSPHGCPPATPRHAGDLGNVEIGSDGAAHFETILQGYTIEGGDRAITGRALILHAGEDDCVTQPTGNAGDRLACGVIGGAAAGHMDHQPATTDATDAVQ
jgi:Cu-Zn family superoxide dismutase